MAGLDYNTIQDYLLSLVPERPGELQKMEAYAQKHRFPIIGPVAGQLCYQTARMIGAKSVFEMGSGYGYSTAWFAKAVQENGGGTVHHVVWDEGLSKMAQGHLSALGYADMISYHVSEAVQQLRETPGPGLPRAPQRQGGEGLRGVRPPAKRHRAGLHPRGAD